MKSLVNYILMNPNPVVFFVLVVIAAAIVFLFAKNIELTVCLDLKKYKLKVQLRKKRR